MVDNLKIDTGFSLAAGLVGGLIPAVIGYVVCVWLNARIEIPLRDAHLSTEVEDKPESSLPSFFWSILPVILPIVLIGISSLFKVIKDGATAPDGSQIAWCVSFYQSMGEENFASGAKPVDGLYHVHPCHLGQDPLTEIDSVARAGNSVNQAFEAVHTVEDSGYAEE